MVTTTTAIASGALRTTLDLFETGLELMRQNLRRRHPNATPDEIDRLLDNWLRDRPGAEFGDCTGRPCDVTGKFG
jgi:hypothetical protein